MSGSKVERLTPAVFVKVRDEVIKVVDHLHVLLAAYFEVATLLLNEEVVVAVDGLLDLVDVDRILAHEGRNSLEVTFHCQSHFCDLVLAANE